MNHSDFDAQGLKEQKTFRQKIVRVMTRINKNTNFKTITIVI